MDVDEKLIRKVAQIARIELSPKEVEEFTPQLKEVLESFLAIDEVDVEGLSPSFQPVRVRNVLRDDVVKRSLTQEEALRNSPHSKDGYFKGPKAV